MQRIPNKNTAPTFSKTTRKDVIIMESFENVLSVVSGQTLMELTLPPQDYVIRGLLPMGLSTRQYAQKVNQAITAVNPKNYL